MGEVWSIPIVYENKDDKYPGRHLEAQLVDGCLFLLQWEILAERKDLIVNNKYANMVTVYRIDTESGKYTKTSCVYHPPEIKPERGGDPFDPVFHAEKGRLYLRYPKRAPLFDITDHIRIADREDFPETPWQSVTSVHYTFGDKDVFMKSEMVVCCNEKSTGKTIWTQRIRHYLYTPIECKNGCLYFGTAGNGGALYGLSPETGEILLELRLGDCCDYFWLGEKIVIADRRKDKWRYLMVDVNAGAALEYTDLYGWIRAHDGNHCYVSKREYNRSLKRYQDSFLRFDL